MAVLALKRLRGMRERARRRRGHKLRARRPRPARSLLGAGSKLAASSKAKEGSSARGKRLGDSGPNLPEDIWCHIHSLMPMQDSARSACVSRAFLHSWRCRPNLIFTKETISLKQNVCGKGDIARAFTSRVDQIMKSHLGTGVKTLELNVIHRHDLSTCYINDWLQIAITPGMESLSISLPLAFEEKYCFPWSLLLGQNGSSIRYLRLNHLALHPTVAFGCLRSLTTLHLCNVHMTGEELGCLLSNSLALEEFELEYCSEIICLKIPSVLVQLSCLTVSGCSMLQMIESEAPNLSTFHFDGDLVQLSFGQSFQVKDLFMECLNECNFLSYAITELPSIAPNLESVNILISDHALMPWDIIDVGYLHTDGKCTNCSCKVLAPLGLGNYS